MRLSEVPHDALEHFCTAASAIHALHVQDAAAAFRAIRPHFEALLNAGDDIAQQVVGSMLDQLKDDPFYQSINWDINQVLLNVNQDYALSISILSNTPENLFNTISNSYYGVLGLAPFHYTLFAHPEDSDREVFDKTKTPTPVGTFTTFPGQILELHAGIDIIDWDIVEPVLMLRYSSKISETLQWTYARNTLEPQFAAAAIPDSTQLTCIASFLGASRYMPGLDALHKLIGHPHHHVRWTAIRALCALDLDAGKRATQAAKSDRHPHVQQAAQRLLDRLGSI